MMAVPTTPLCTLERMLQSTSRWLIGVYSLNPFLRLTGDDFSMYRARLLVYVFLLPLLFFGMR